MLNIARTIHAGFPVTKSKYDLQEVEIIPFGNSINETKKLAKASSKYLSLPDYDNIPLPGFTLYKTDKKNWGSTDSTWLVIDPRGFLVRISSTNLEDILHVTGITEGLIQQECVWARENSDTKMVLVPVSSPDYHKAIKNTDLLENKIVLKDVQVGDTVLLQNGLQGIYRGVISFYGNMVSTRRKKYKPYTGIRKQVIEVSPQKYYYQTDLKIITTLSNATTPMTREESIDSISKEIELGIASFSQTVHKSGVYFGMIDNIRLISKDAVPKVKITLEPITKEEAGEIYCMAAKIGDIGRLVLEHVNGRRYVIDFPFSYYKSSGSPAALPIDTFNVAKLLDIDLLSGCIELDKVGKYSLNTIDTIFTLDNFVKFYKIEKHVKNNTYI